jgi:hypothetical protein
MFSFHPIMLQCGEGHVMPEIARCQVLTVEAWVQPQTRLCEIVVDKVASRFFYEGCSLPCQYHSISASAAVYPVSTITSALQPQFTLSVPFHQRSSCSLPCQYHSISAPTAVYPVSTIPSVLHTHSSIYYRCFITFAVDSTIRHTKRRDAFPNEEV